MKEMKTTQQMITIRAVFETVQDAFLVLYRRGSHKVLREIPFRKSDYDGLVRSAVVEGMNADEFEYNFRVGNRIIQDPKAQLIRGRRNFGKPVPKNDPHQVRCALLSKPFDWKEDHPLRLPYEDVISYALHVRGFTKHPRSGVRLKGTFGGLTEKIPYLKELGINQVILMPAYEFDEIVKQDVVGHGQPASVELPAEATAIPAEAGTAASSGVSGEKPKVNYWGYGPGLYFAPKESFAAGPDPDLEFKTMVRAFHEAGIEVIMEFAFHNKLALSYIVECLSWWIHEYHVDGFVLMADPECVRILTKSPLLADVKLMSGYFDTSRIYPGGRSLPGRVLADVNEGFRNDCRRLLKGDEDMLGAFVSRMRANDREKGIVNYIAGHDGFTLMDLVSFDRKHNEENGEQGRDGSNCEYSWNCGVEGPSRKSSVRALRLRQRKNAMAMLLLAQGTPMILAGDEFGNSQNGNNNPWCQDNEIAWVDWGKSTSGQELTAFVRELIALRKAHPVLHAAAPLTGTDTTSCGYPDFSCHGSHAWYSDFEYQNRHVGIMLCSGREGEEDYVYIAFNMYWDAQTLALPYLPEGWQWEVVADTSGEMLRENAQPQREFTLPGRSVCVLTGGRILQSAEKKEATEK